MREYWKWTFVKYSLNNKTLPDQPRLKMGETSPPEILAMVLLEATIQKLQETPVE